MFPAHDITLQQTCHCSADRGGSMFRSLVCAAPHLKPRVKGGVIPFHQRIRKDGIVGDIGVVVSIDPDDPVNV